MKLFEILKDTKTRAIHGPTDRPIRALRYDSRRVEANELSPETERTMPVIHEWNSASPPMSEAEREKVREQLNRLLETHHFKNSRRYPPLLRFIVEETLEGRGEYLKERLLGVRVFDRPADYDTAMDPIVRVTIAEIRKRIAQYYHDEEHDAEIRIELAPGRYAPEFRSRNPRRDADPDRETTTMPANRTAVELSPPGPELPVPATPRLPALRSRALWYWTAACVLLLVIFAPRLQHWLRPSALEEFWAPIEASHGPVLVCIPTRDASPPITAASVDTTFRDFEALGENVVYSDMLAIAKAASVLSEHHLVYKVRPNASTTLQDLREGPAVQIGGMDNQWSKRALAPLRYRLAGGENDFYWVTDSKDPSNHALKLDGRQRLRSVNQDYAIIARLHNDETGQPELIVAGLGMSGTAAAGEFIANESALQELRRRVGAGFKDGNFEAVLSTDVVNGIAGSPKIIAVSVW